jgi:hypothetical protein
MLAHTVHAVVSGKPVKVECNTCHGVHRYRDPPGTAAKAAKAVRSAGSPRAERPARERAPVIAFDELIASKTGTAHPYSPKRTFAVDEVVDHPTFGRGFVSAIRDGGKIEVTFRSDVKLLVHGRS